MRLKQPVTLTFLFLLFYLLGMAQNVIPKPGYNRINDKYVKVAIDSKSSLSTLISQLSRDRDIHLIEDRFNPGYTALVFSIAAHEDAAIMPLLSLADSTKDLAVRYNVVLALNLIGIKNTVTGHYSENFVDKQARVALLSMLKYQDIKGTVLHTLLRDPWQSDVPALFLAMKNDTSNSCFIQCALVRYLLKDFPIRQKIPSWADTVTLTAPNIVRSRQTDSEALNKIMLSDMVMLHLPDLEVEKRIRLLTWREYSYPRIYQTHNGVITTSLTEYINTVAGLDYCSTYNNEFQYYISDNKLIFCSSTTTKKILLNWWDSMPGAYKLSFNKNQAKTPSPFLLKEDVKD